MTEQYSAYDKYRETREELEKLLLEATEAIAIQNTMSFEEEKRVLKELSDKVGSDSFKIQVVGTFKNGKSTFINSFLGAKVLPAFARPCTAIISEIKYGEESRAFLHFRNPPPPPDKLPANTPMEVREHLSRQRDDGMDIPQMEVGVDKIEEFVVIPKDKEQKDTQAEGGIYEKIVLRWPLDLLKSGVEIIDSPGLNEHGVRTEVTTKYLNKADAILFILAADKPCAEDEMRFITINLNGNNFRNLFFLFNRFDQLDNDTDRQDIKELAKVKLSDKTDLAEGIYFISARDALNGKINKDKALYDGSGMREFENALSDFLVNDRGKSKLSQPANNLKRILREIEKAIPQRRNLLESSLEDLVDRWEKVQQRLERLKDLEESTRKNIREMIDLDIPNIKLAVKEYFLRKLTSSITTWITDFEPKTNVSVWSYDNTYVKVANEIFNYIARNIEESLIEFHNELAQRIGNAKARIDRANENNVLHFFRELDAIEASVAGISELNIVSDDLFNSNIDSLLDFFKEGLPEEPVSMLETGCIIVLAPFTLLESIFLGDTTLKDIKEALIKDITEELQAKGKPEVENIGNTVAASLWGAFEPTLDTMKTRIRLFEEEVNAVIEEKQAGESEIAPTLEMLNVCEEHVRNLSNRVDDFISVNLGVR